MRVAALVLVALLPLATGCNTPAKVCTKLKELDSLPMGGQTGCQIKWGKLKSDNAEKYNKDAECVLAAKSKDELSKCGK